MTSADSLALIICFGLGAYLWLDGARARELAVFICNASCQRRGFQFLDDSVALARLAPRWTRDGIRIRRMFQFDFSIEGTARHTGHIILVGTRLELVDFGILDESEDEAVV